MRCPPDSSDIDGDMREFLGCDSSLTQAGIPNPGALSGGTPVGGYPRLTFGAVPQTMCRAGCQAYEIVSQVITVPWNVNKLYFKHRRESPGADVSPMRGSYVRLLIHEPGKNASVSDISRPSCLSSTCPVLLAGQSVWPCTVPEWPCAAADWMSYRACGCTLELPAIEAQNTSIDEHGTQLWMISCETDDSGSRTSCHHGPNGVPGCSARPCGYVEEEVDMSVFAPPLNDSTRQLKLSFVARTRDSFSAFIDDIRLTYKIPGCMDTSACNYNPTAEIDDGTCAAQIRGCTLPTAANFDPYANMDPGDRCSAFTSDWLQPDGTPTFNLLHNVALRPVTRSPRITISTDDALVLNYNTSSSARQLSAGVYPYWSVRLQLSGVPDTEDRRCRFNVKVRSPGAVALSTILYQNFAPVSPSKNVTSGVECEHLNGQLTGGHAFCPSNTQLVTSLSYGVEYTLLVIPSDLNQSPDVMDDPFDLDILALEGSIAIISPLCGNGIVDAMEQCDPVDARESYLNGADAEWCSGTCQGILGSFAFETDSISIAEGEETAVKVVRKLPPDWIPNDAGTHTVNIQIFTSDGTATSADDDFERIDRKMIEFLPSETMSKPIVIESQVDFVHEYPTEHFFLNMELICETPSCDYSTALHYPHGGDALKSQVSPGIIVFLTMYRHVCRQSASPGNNAPK